MSFSHKSVIVTGAAIQQALNFSPDLIIASLMLPGLSGKDLLVALRSQGMDVPMLVTAPVVCSATRVKSGPGPSAGAGSVRTGRGGVA